ncbi:MAG: NAD(P) transhydrogenase subunit beta [Planctomycetes bacterium]|nr:NAD(P) transhydrogenase subunit beta [Planctomycetota bacterium]
MNLLTATMQLKWNESLAEFGFIASVIMFMLAIMRMSKVKTARSGNWLAAGAMALAVISQFVEEGQINPVFIIVGIVVGAAVGAFLAWRVQMTQMPEMVALLNGFGGLSSMFVGLASYFQYMETGARGTLASLPAVGAFTGVNLMLTVIVGGLTFTGSVIAFLKLSEKIRGVPILLPARHAINVALGLLALGLSALAVWAVSNSVLGVLLLVLVGLLALAMGITLVLAIGGGDMPVVISLLNSYSGIAGALAGFTINSPVLIVSGSLVGASGIILTMIMCKAMNRSLANVMFGGFGAAETGEKKKDEYKNVKSCDVEEAALVLADAQSCIVVPGYGMAVAQAQHAVRELADQLSKRGCTVRYAVHPVAGRMPGHMNVLLAEANVPYDQLFEMDAINNDFKNTDVAIVIGANDVVNPAAKDNKASPLYGMPVLNVEEARSVFVIKRSLGAGFAGVKNELFEKDNVRMLYADGRKACEDLIKALKEA